jgi:hypothetical protein
LSSPLCYFNRLIETLSMRIVIIGGRMMIININNSHEGVVGKYTIIHNHDSDTWFIGVGNGNLYL